MKRKQEQEDINPITIITLNVNSLNTPIKRDWRPSRWQRSKTWRSPSSKNYIRNISTCGTTPTGATECWKKTSDFPKGKKHPTYMGRAKEKRKKQRQKNRDGTCTSGRELWRRKSFQTLGSPFGGGDRGWWGGSFGATEESTAIGVHGAKWRDSHTKDQCWPALTSPRGLSAHLPGWVGAGSWDSGFRGQTPGRGLGLAVWTQPEGGYCATASLEGVWDKVWTCLRGKRPLFWGVQGEGIQSTA